MARALCGIPEITRYQEVNTRPLREPGPGVLAQLLTLMLPFIFIPEWFLKQLIRTDERKILATAELLHVSLGG